MNILAFCFFPAYTPPGSGGESRLFNFYRALSRHHQVTLITSAGPHDAEQTINHGVNFIERRVPKDGAFGQQWQALLPSGSGGDLSAPCLANCAKYPSRLHEVYLEEYGAADVIVHDFPFMIDYDIFLGLDEKLRVYNAHNCESKLYRSLHPSAQSATIHAIVDEAERRLLTHVDLLLYCAAEDLDAFREMAPEATYKAVYAPHGIEPAQRRAAARQASQPMRAYFIGSAHPPNVAAAKFIAEQLAPELPQVQFDIVGQCLPEGSYGRNVRRHGMVSEPEKVRIMSGADIALNPMTEGSGANIKVLDYLASGLPVMSTTFGMRGVNAIAGRDYIEAPLAHFADELRALAGDAERLAGIARAGHQLVLDSYTWNRIAEQISGVFESAREDKGAVPFERFVLALNDYDSFGSVGGGGTRSKGLYQAVSCEFPVVFLCYSNDDRLQLRREGAGIVVIAVPKSDAQKNKQAWFSARFHMSVDDVVASHHCAEQNLFHALYRVLRTRARIVVLEHCYLVPLPARYGDRYIYSSHNDEASMKASILRGHPDYEALMQRVELLEGHAVENAAMTLCVSEDDAHGLLKGKQAGGPMLVIRNGASEPAPEEQVQAARASVAALIGERSVVFLGSAHGPNVDAANHLVRHVAPRCPDVQFHLVGSVCDAVPDRRDNVHAWGVVDDARKCAILGACSVGLNPVVSGGGSNIKMADYIANGLYVISTDFGVRGYPEAVQRHIMPATLEDFPAAIRRSLDDAGLHSAAAKASRRLDFSQHLSMKALGGQLTHALRELEVPKKRILFVAYRYTAPALGGAEVHMDTFLRALGESGRFMVDVVAPEVSEIRNHFRFTERYGFDAECSAPYGVPNLRFARFAASASAPVDSDRQLARIWRAQPRFEQALSDLLAPRYRQAGLTWGWADPEGQGETAIRWAMTECALYAPQDTEITVRGRAGRPLSVAVTNEGTLIDHRAITGTFELKLNVNAGEVIFNTSGPQVDGDPRPLGFLLTDLSIGGQRVDIGADTLMKKAVAALDAFETFSLMDRAAGAGRGGRDLSLTDSRGPWSRGLEAFVREQVSAYDLVVTNNNVFRPAVLAISEARRQGVPSILIPHAHLDDDFYHFPDLRESEQQASLVLASPSVAADFLRTKGSNAIYLPAGCDTTEQFSEADELAFREIHRSDRPFVLVLGRKSGAKGYVSVIDAVGQLNAQGVALDVVLIGPDDDGRLVSASYASYLGRQPRNVVRGALRSSLMLCNMSSSESFGIVLLEAWLAGTPVVANQQCAAFRDLVEHERNGLLADKDSLAPAIRRLYDDPALRHALAEQGAQTAQAHSWAVIQEKFVSLCLELAHPEGAPAQPTGAARVATPVSQGASGA
ncbi:glycosyltransferase [Bordetella sp. 02P26C-1]|uniref:glycosyltransferase n=1 Tax=Bordetella sp. 02P26C-1 TaxID=2683195 RepID=UPI001354DC43|nr:glycosyltransferase [Bordetella sp. 02P26C-1]MVW79404.1 glycosyltransferase [Bordetella sp. 02P26C-1]